MKRSVPTSRGLRNNNPGNIRLGADTWRGEVTPSDDPVFRRFASMAWGYRAMFMVLDTYRRRYGLRTVSGLIGRWAPPSENDTGAYAALVADRARAGQVDFADAAMMQRIAAAMSLVENGREAVAEDVAAGWELFVKYRK
ncbi:MAG: structural protein P5 [Rikenellaceae bacterium]|nr:structural protein P5 [Rikenellaceae bacterium]